MLIKGHKQYHSDNAIIVLTTNIVYKQKREERKFLSKSVLGTVTLVWSDNKVKIELIA